MRLITIMVVACTCISSIAHAGGVRAEIRAELAQHVMNRYLNSSRLLLDYYRNTHAHPELSLHEKRTSNAIAGMLSKYGFAVTKEVGGYGVVGVLENGDGPIVLIRADMDALPITEESGLEYASKVTATGADGQPTGVMHACGHDVHQTCLIGTAEILSRLKKEWRGTVVLVAQPAEEIGTGALAMINDGLFERFPKPDYCIALHVSSELKAGMLGYTSGWALANVDSVDITIHGRGGHGSRPDQTVDPITVGAHVVTSLQTIVSRRVDPREPAVITVGSFHAGSKHNIIPDTATLQLTVRSYTDETRRLLLDGIREITVNTARALGCDTDPDVIAREKEYTPAVYNDPRLSKAAAKVLEEVVGSDNFVEVKPQMGGEDFGHYARHLRKPGFMFWLGSATKEAYFESLRTGGASPPPLHSNRFVPDLEPTIRTGVISLSSLALSLLEKP